MTVNTYDMFGAVLVGATEKVIEPERLRLVEAMRDDPWEFLTAVDPVTGKVMIHTRDERSDEGFRPWPNREYLKKLARALVADMNEPELQIAEITYLEKSRQMIVSTLCCLLILRETIFEPARRWLISRTKEDDAVELIRDKIRAPYSQLPLWFRRMFPITTQPQRLVKALGTDSYIGAVTQNVAFRAARGGTATGFLVDEGAYQDFCRDIMVAAPPMCRRIWVVSTPSLLVGGRFMYEKIAQATNVPPIRELSQSIELPEDLKKIVGPHIKSGLVVRQAPEGYRVITVPFWSDPGKATVSWARARQAEQPDQVSFRREYLIDWSSAEGDPYFDEFAQHPTRYVSKDIDFIPNRPIVRGWDFGRRWPFCLLLQESPTGQILVLREIAPTDISIYNFRDLVMLMCGQSLRRDLLANDYGASLQYLKEFRPYAWKWFEYYLNNPPWWPDGDPDRIPYPLPFLEFGHQYEFIEASGPEATQKHAFESEKGERSYAESLSARGIVLRWNDQPISYGETVLRRLLLDMPNGEPGILFHPSCRTSIEAMNGALTYRKATGQNLKGCEVADVSPYIDFFDTVRYALVNMRGVADRVESYRRRITHPDSVEDMVEMVKQQDDDDEEAFWFMRQDPSNAYMGNL